MAITAVAEALKDHPQVREARFWLFDDAALAAFEAAAS